VQKRERATVKQWGSDHRIVGEEDETWDAEKWNKAAPKLAEIFTEAMLPRVEYVCKWYLGEAENEQERPSPSDDGQYLMELAEATDCFASLIFNNNESAILRTENPFIVGDILDKLQGFYPSLCILAREARKSPAAEDLGKRKRPRDRKKAQRFLASSLWNIYKTAHGKPPGRTNNHYANQKGQKEGGPMVRAMEILKPLLGTSSNLASVFKELNTAWNMDNKSTVKKSIHKK